MTALAVAWLYPRALGDAQREARENAALGYLDRELAGGNAVVADQQAMIEARARIPEGEAYEVVVGAPHPSWSELTASSISGFARSFLLPRRQVTGAPWVICYGCDRGTFPGATAVWESDEGISLLRRPG